MAHEERYDHGEYRYQRVEHGYAARFVEVVAAEQAEIACEQHYHDGNEYHLSDDVRRYLVCRSAAALHLPFE